MKLRRKLALIEYVLKVVHERDELVGEITGEFRIVVFLHRYHKEPVQVVDVRAEPPFIGDLKSHMLRKLFNRIICKKMRMCTAGVAVVAVCKGRFETA